MARSLRNGNKNYPASDPENQTMPPDFDRLHRQSERLCLPANDDDKIEFRRRMITFTMYHFVWIRRAIPGSIQRHTQPLPSLPFHNGAKNLCAIPTPFC